MLLSSLVKGLDYRVIKGDLNIEVNSLAYDSREVTENSAFVAISGFSVDGHQFIGQAIKNGATTIFVENHVSIDGNVTVLKVSDSREALAKLASNLYNSPTQDLNLIGITGTNGKTSTSFFIKSIFEQTKQSIGLIGTIGTIIGEIEIKNERTTPESLQLQQIFSKMVQSKIRHCIMEVSSHALSLKRVDYSHFKTGIYTNLSPDHLELHDNMEEYFEAKAKLFELTNDYNIVNIDDEYGKKLIAKIRGYDAQLITYGIDNKADIFPSAIKYSADSTSYIVHTPKGSINITVHIPGKINVYNSLAAIACAYCNNINLKDIQLGIRNIHSIKGRLEVVYQDKDRKVLIDFAHTEDGLEKALTTIQPYVKGRLLLVFGVYADAGPKGTEKRRGMGKVAAKHAHFSIVTSDNPKNLDPQVIISEIVEAIEEEQGSYIAIMDRKEAIQYAIEMSNKGDVILIAGKGHETAQQVGGVEVPFNETEIVLESIQSLLALK
jgi:UDP-N-acetylmuramoyl-L-alanyl-D-glutamate--2,6-diaminopimelate ligase